MNASEYQQLAARTMQDSDLVNWVLGLCGEAGEVAELVKKSEFHGVSIHREAMSKELGDVAWYLAAVATKMGLDLSQILEQNIAKLRERYPAGFILGGGIRDD